MNKRNILMIIVGITAITNLVLSRVITNYSPILELCLTVPFFLIIIIFYRKTPLITAFCVLTVLSQFGYYMVMENAARISLDSITQRIYGSFSFFAGIAAFFVAFAVVLQNKTYKLIERSFLYFAIINYVFFSYFNFYLHSYLIRFFGPFEIHIIKMYQVYYVVLIVIEVSLVVLQIILIYFLERNKWFELRLKLRDQEIMNSKITD